MTLRWMTLINRPPDLTFFRYRPRSAAISARLPFHQPALDQRDRDVCPALHLVASAFYILSPRLFIFGGLI